GALSRRPHPLALQPPFVCADVIDSKKLTQAIRAHFTAFDLIEGEGEVALALRWLGAPSYQRIAAFAEGIRHGLATTIERRKPLYIMLDGDIAQTLGAILREELLVARPRGGRRGQRQDRGARRRGAPRFRIFVPGPHRFPALPRPAPHQALAFQGDPPPRPPAAAHPSSRARPPSSWARPPP